MREIKKEFEKKIIHLQASYSLRVWRKNNKNSQLENSLRSIKNNNNKIASRRMKGKSCKKVKE